MAKEGKTILIVDDQQADAHLLQRNLEKVGVKTPTLLLSSGQAILDYLKGGLADFIGKDDALPAAIFLDLRLGDMSGLEVLNWITTQPPLRRVLVVIHSGIATPKDIDALYAAGANSFLRKANDLQELQSLVDYFKGYFGK